MPDLRNRSRQAAGRVITVSSGSRGDVDARAECRLALEHDDLVADLGEAGGGGESGKPAADDGDQRAASQARKAVTPRRIWASSSTARAIVAISRMPARIAACTG